MPNVNRKILVISAPSGTGKTTIAEALDKQIKDIELITTFTTRKPRPGEQDSHDYHFVVPIKFKEMIDNNDLAEWAEVYGNYYGTPKKDIISAIKKGKTALLIIDTQGGRSIKKRFPEAVLIGILPPSIKEQERRIRERSGNVSEQEIQRRLEAAKEERKIILSQYDLRFINKNLENTIKNIVMAIRKKFKS